MNFDVYLTGEVFSQKRLFFFIDVYPMWAMWKKSVHLGFDKYTRENILPQNVHLCK